MIFNSANKKFDGVLESPMESIPLEFPKSLFIYDNDKQVDRTQSFELQLWAISKSLL